MKRDQAHVGMRVIFGHESDEQTLGQIVNFNPARAKVESLEQRQGRPLGTRFNVPYHLMQPADDEQAPAS